MATQLYRVLHCFSYTKLDAWKGEVTDYRRGALLTVGHQQAWPGIDVCAVPRIDVKLGVLSAGIIGGR